MCRGKTESLNQYNIHELVRGSETPMQKDMLRSCTAKSMRLDHTIQQLKASLQSESAPSHYILITAAADTYNDSCCAFTQSDWAQMLLVQLSATEDVLLLMCLLLS